MSVCEESFVAQGGFEEATMLLVGWRYALYRVQGGLRIVHESRDPMMSGLVWLAMREFHDEAVIARPRLWPWISGSDDEGGSREV